MCVQKEGKGYRLWVAIADVAHYVPAGSHLDLEARERGNSYYFPRPWSHAPGEALQPACAPEPGGARLCMVAELRFGPDGGGARRGFLRRGHAEPRPAHLRPGAPRLEEHDPAEEKALAEHLPMLRQAEALARILNRMRSGRGSLDFDLPEPEIHFNYMGEAVDISPRPRTFAHQIVEEFMIAANEAVARLLTDRGLPCVYRVHESRTRNKLGAAMKLLSRTALGPGLPRPKAGDLAPKDLQNVLAAAQGTDMEYLAAAAPAHHDAGQVHDPQPGALRPGLGVLLPLHLAIRRYADLLVHRSLKAALTGNPPALPSPQKLGTWCEDISARERVAMEAEREIVKRLTVIVLSGRVGESFTGVVSGLSDYGFWVELDQVLAEGMVRLSSLTDDYYAYVPERQRSGAGTPGDDSAGHAGLGAAHGREPLPAGVNLAVSRDDLASLARNFPAILLFFSHIGRNSPLVYSPLIFMDKFCIAQTSLPDRIFSAAGFFFEESI